MQARRWWYSAVLAVLATMTSQAMAASGVTGETISWNAPEGDIKAFVVEQASLLKAAPGSAEAVKVRQEVLAALRTTKTRAGAAPSDFQRKLARAVADDFGPLVLDDKPNVALNAVMTVALVGVGQIETDSALVAALKSPNASVRYWAAKGLVDLIGVPSFKLIGGAYMRAVDGLGGALRLENSPLVREQLIKALTASGSVKAVDPLLDALKTMSLTMQSTPPDGVTLVAAKANIDALTALAGKSDKSLDGTPDAPMLPLHVLDNPRVVMAVQATVNLMSFSAQHLLAAGGTPAAANLQGDVFNVAKAGVDLINKLAGKEVAALGGLKASSSVADMVDTIRVLTGGDAEDGKVQGAFKTVKKPEKIQVKPAGAVASQPTTAVTKPATAPQTAPKTTPKPKG